MFFKRQTSNKNDTKIILGCSWYYIIIIKYYWSMRYCFRFPTDFLFIFFKSLFSSRAEVLLSWITENKNVSSGNSLAFEGNPSDKSLIYIKNNNGPVMEPWGSPALTSDQSKTCPFNKTLCFLFLRKSRKRFSKLPDIPFSFNLKMRPSCQTLSNASIYLEKHL